MGSLSMDASPTSSSPPSPMTRPLNNLVNGDRLSQVSESSTISASSSTTYGSLGTTPTAAKEMRRFNNAPLTIDELACALHPELGFHFNPHMGDSDHPELLLLDNRNFMAFGRSHIRGSHNINIPRMLINRYKRALNEGGEATKMSSIFSRFFFFFFWLVVKYKNIFQIATRARKSLRSAQAKRSC